MEIKIIIKRALFFNISAIIIFVSSCSRVSDQTKQTSVNNVAYGPTSIWGKRRINLDTFVSNLENYKWSDKLLGDTVKNFSEIFDTFYLIPQTGLKVYILYNSHPNRYKWFQNRHFYFASKWYGYPIMPEYIIFGTVHFSHCTFYINNFFNSFHDIIFKSRVIFENNIFPDSTIIQNICFEETVRFVDTSRNCFSPRFITCSFSNGLEFNYIQISNLGSHPIFPSIAYFVGCSFNSNVVFTNCNINGTLSFKNCRFENGSSIVMEGTTLPDTLDLSNLKISGILKLIDIPARQGRICYLNLLNADIEKIILRYNNFKLYFPEKYFTSGESKDMISMY